MPFLRKICFPLGAILVLLPASWLLLTGRAEGAAETVAEAIGAAGWLPFFSAMTLLPLAGLPVTPFYVIGGAVFGEWVCLLGTAISLFVNLSLAYAMAARWMRNALQALLARHGGHRMLPAFSSRRNTWLYILATRLTPGPPLSVKNYMAGLAGVPFAPYMLIAWPISMGYAAGLILLGDSLTEQHGLGILAGIIVLALFLGVMVALRSWLSRRVDRLHRSDGASATDHDGQDPAPSRTRSAETRNT